MGALVSGVRRELDGGCVSDCVLLPVRERRKYEEALLAARRAADQARAEAEARQAEVERANELLEQQGVELELQHQQLEDQAAELEVAGEELRAINEALLARTHELEAQRAIADEANQAKSQFLANMSHELRTPLNAIAGYVQLLELGVHGPVTAAQEEALGRVTRAQRHLLRLINEILNLARIESGHVEYDLAPVSMEALVSSVIPLVEPQLAAAGLACRVDVPAALVAVADREKAQQVLLNLLTNAIKFTPAGGITVAAGDDAAAGVVRLHVRDTGIGIPADRLQNVFEPFVQVRAELTRPAEGTGLGLAISRDLARGMGGDLWAESGPAGGSTFTLELLAAEPA